MSSTTPARPSTRPHSISHRPNHTRCVSAPTSPRPDQPALLIWADGADFAVLAAFNGVVPAVGQPLLASAKPTLVTSWLAVPAGILTVTDLNSNAHTTTRGPKLWNKDRQYASLTITFRNTQSGRFRWSPDSVTIVDQLGRGYQSKVDAIQAPTNTATPAAANSASRYTPNSTVRLSVEYKVPPGTEIRYVVVSDGASMTVVAATAQSADDPNLAYNNDLVQMLDLAASEWSRMPSGRPAPIPPWPGLISP